MGQVTELSHHKQIPSETVKKIQLARLKSWHMVFQYDQIEHLWFDLEGESYTEDARIMIETSLADTINIKLLETSGHHLLDKFIRSQLGLSLVPGSQA